MKTLKELNEKAWYRLVKVLYVFLYLLLLPWLFSAYDITKIYHQPVYPNSIIEALNDPEFYKVSDADREMTLLQIASKNDRYYMLWNNNSSYFEFQDKIKKVDINTHEWIDLKLDLTKINWDSPSEDYQLQNQSKRFVTISPRKNPTSQIETGGKYIYAKYYTRNMWNLGFLLLGVMCYMLIMEIIRRTFYYVAIGKLFPKE